VGAGRGERGNHLSKKASGRQEGGLTSLTNTEGPKDYRKGGILSHLELWIKRSHPARGGILYRRGG